jgi:nicotinate-nucleotide adenylyltransferase
MQKMIGVLGGTFDPIHHGHLRIALEISQQLKLDEVRFIPCQQPILKNNAQATAEQRLAMLRLAVQDQAGFIIDERELKRATPSYTIDTLISLREEFKTAALYFIMGADSFNELPQWQRWQELTQYANLVVVTRPNFTLTTPTQENSVRKIYQIELPPLAISSTNIRRQIAQGLSPRYLMPDAVWHYIQQHHLYQNNL